MNFVFILIGMNVTIIFLFDKSKLDNKFWFYRLLFVNALLFLIASLCLLNNMGKGTTVNSLFVPLIGQLAYYGLSKVFYSMYKRNSIDTYMTMDKSLFIDGWFNFIFYLISIMLFILVL